MSNKIVPFIPRKYCSLLFILAAMLCLCSCATSKKYEYSVVKADDPNEYDFTYDELKHRIIVETPDVIDENTDVLVMLHGYGSRATDMKRTTRMDEYALDRNYIVVYITGAPDPNDPTSAYGWNAGWNSLLRESEKDDVGLLKALVQYIQSEYELTSKRAFVAGFSNGGFMTFRLATEASDTFTACASVAGKMPKGLWDIKNNKKTSGFLQINGSLDDVVPMKLNGSAEKAQDPAIEDVIDYFADVNKCKNIESVSLSDKSELIKHTGKGKTEIWQVIINEGRHSWPEEAFCGFDVNDLILDFFDLYR